MKLEKQKEERLRREQQLRSEKLKQEQQRQEERLKQVNQHRTNNNSWGNSASNSWTTNNSWGNNPSNQSSGKVYVQGYRRKDGTWVEGYWRNK